MFLNSLANDRQFNTYQETTYPPETKNELHQDHFTQCKAASVWDLMQMISKLDLSHCTLGMTVPQNAPQHSCLSSVALY